MSTVIAAIDSSLAARPVLAMARTVAPLFGAGIVAVHVVEDPDGPSPAGRGHTAQAEADDAGIALRWLRGDAVRELSAAVADDEVVALVIGAHRHAVGGRAGHLPLALASCTDKPVIVVHPTATPPEQLRRVLVAIEGRPGRGKELKRAVELIEATGLEIVVVHVDDEASIPSFSDQVQHETEAYAAEFFGRFLPGLSHARLELRIGDAVEQILTACDETEAELLAVGWPQTEAGGRGRVAHALLDRCTIPVLLVATA
jgi:nucleotide-binding universal stress UspA family protein